MFSRSAILSARLSEVFSNHLTISPPKTMLYFTPNDVLFTLKHRFVSLKRYDVIVLISARKLSFLLFFSHLRKNT